MTFRLPGECAQQLIGYDDIEIVMASLDLPQSDVDEARLLLSDEEKQRADRFVFDRDRNRFIVARATLRTLLAERLKVDPKSIELSYGEFGKPYLAGQFAYSELAFNVSHSEDVAVFAITCGREVGIDVEAIVDMKDRDEVAGHCFSAREVDAYRSLDEEDRTLGFYNCWTRKEALVKALGDGLNFSLADFDVTLAPDAPAKILGLGTTPGEDCGWELHAFSPQPGFVAAVVIEASRS
jgi:4'-phosphopantetheinyl transferase